MAILVAIVVAIMVAVVVTIVVACVLDIKYRERCGEWDYCGEWRNGDGGRARSARSHCSKSWRSPWIDNIPDRTHRVWKSAVEVAGSGPGHIAGGSGQRHCSLVKNGGPSGREEVRESVDDQNADNRPQIIYMSLHWTSSGRPPMKREDWEHRPVAVRFPAREMWRLGGHNEPTTIGNHGS